ncbi:unnamed protein product [marine sediment metagenome]|uniref:Uncharacterized protein n=1 Tax=marine sediment metagenome TaxID=412755 RepID=X0RNE6_9ZZZZ
MAIHDNFANLAVKLITKNGRAITVRSKVKTPDPTEPWKLTSITTTDQTTIGAFFDNTLTDLEIALGQVLGAPEGARSNLSQKGTRVYIPARDLTAAISAEDVIIDSTRTWEIVAAELFQPGPTPIMYICTLGR